MRIMEYVQSPPTRIDHSRSVIRGVKVCGQRSANGRVYPLDTLSAAASKYEGVGVFVDHPASLGSSRSYRDRIGSLHNVRVEGGSLRGDLHYNSGHPQAAQLLDDAERGTPGVGLSHVVDAVGRRDGSGQTRIETIRSVASVDLVCSPATVSSLFEHSAVTAESDFAGFVSESVETHPATLRQFVAHITGDGAGSDRVSESRIRTAADFVKYITSD